ncbi:MAG TPA: hypothetical protein VKZ53_31410 [Candidatus Angelobacter sp.]|nr:hypothetical protein [Candidatus Angelobacter sp.]
MQRLTSITALFALAFSLWPTFMAMSCGEMTAGASCHRSKAMHHCENMAMEMDDAQANDEEAGAPTLSSANLSDPSNKCPMQCCISAHGGKHFVLSHVASVSSHAFSHVRVYATRVIFANLGHSSHTDRGPPFA